MSGASGGGASQRLPGVHSGVKSTVAPGDPMARSQGQYGKGYDPAQAASNASLPVAQDEKAQPVPVVRSKGDVKGGLKTPREYQKAAIDAGSAASAFQ